MAELVGNCPRCDTKAITFDLLQATLLGQVSRMVQGRWEAFCVCRMCHRSTIFVLHQKKVAELRALQQGGLTALQGTVNDHVLIHAHVGIANFKKRPSPEHLSGSVEAAFQEGATCLAVGCFNAAAAMFRLSLDLAIKDLFPDEAGKDKFLGPRLDRLFENKMLPEALRELSSVVKDDGNAGAHDGTIDEATAEDLVDFTESLFAHLYTQPEKLRLAQERSAQREAQRASAKS